MKSKYKLILCALSATSAVSFLPATACTINSKNIKTAVQKKNANLSTSKYCKIQFENPIDVTLEGTTVVTVRTGKTFATVTKPIATKEGCDFIGWSVKGSTTILEDNYIIPSVSELDLIPNFSSSKVTITFDPAGGICSESIRTINWNSKIGELPTPVPQEPEYTFAGWYVNNVKIDENYVVKDNTIVEARFKIKEFKITFIAEPGATLEGSTELTDVKYGTKLKDVPTPKVNIVNPAQHSFLGWYINDQILDPEATVTTNLTITAKLSINKYSVNLVCGPNGSLSGGTTSFTNIDYGTTFGSLSNKPTPVPSDHYDFAGWYVNGSSISDSYQITANTTVEARFKPQVYHVIWNGNPSGSYEYGWSGDYENSTQIPTPPTGCKGIRVVECRYRNGGNLATDVWYDPFDPHFGSQTAHIRIKGIRNISCDIILRTELVYG